MLRLFKYAIATWIAFAPCAWADITLTDSNLDTMAVSGVITTGGTVSITHVSHIGALNTTADDVVTITDYAQVGTPTLAVNATCNQVATTGTPAGDGVCSEDWIALTGTPFISATDLRLHKTNGSPLFDLATEEYEDARGRNGNDIGAYNRQYPFYDIGTRNQDYLRTYNP